MKTIQIRCARKTDERKPRRARAAKESRKLERVKRVADCRRMNGTPKPKGRDRQRQVRGIGKERISYAAGSNQDVAVECVAR